jgi:hypothetical protein
MAKVFGFIHAMNDVPGGIAGLEFRFEYHVCRGL